MTDVGAVVAALRRAVAGLYSAAPACHKATSAAATVQARSAAMGFDGIATRLASVRERLGQLEARHAGVTAAATQMAELAPRAADDASPAASVATLTSVLQEVDRASETTVTIVSEIDAIRIEVQDALRGGQPGKLVHLLCGMRDQFLRTIDAFADARQRTEAIIAVARRLGHTSGASDVNEFVFDAGSAGAWNVVVNRKLLPHTAYVERRTRYRYETDDSGRVSVVEGNLVDESGWRNSYQQARAGGRDRLDTDDGGHLFATIFRGPGERINLVPMDANLNRGVWQAMERRWARALELGREVRVSVRLHYQAGNTRPTRFEVTYQIQGRSIVVRSFRNAHKGE